MGTCNCTNDGIPCGDNAIEGHDYCGNCHDGECPHQARNEAECQCNLTALGVPMRCGTCDSCVEHDGETFMPDRRTLLEAQIVALVRKHKALDDAVAIMDDMPDSAERRAAGYMLDAMSALDEAIFPLLYSWAECD